MPVFSGETEMRTTAATPGESATEPVRSVNTVASSPDYMSLPVSWEGLSAAQSADPTSNLSAHP